MDNDQVLLVLLAVRMAGGQAPATGDLLKPLKAGVKLARDKGLLTEGTANLPSTNKAGKTTTKKTAVLALSDPGENYLRQAASPEALSATAAGQVQALQKSLEADRLALHDLVKGTLSTQVKPKAGPNLAQLNKEVDKINKTVEKLESELQKISKAVSDVQSKLHSIEGGDRASTSEAVIAKIDQGFVELRARVQQAFAGLTISTVARETPSVPQKPGPDTETQLIRAALRKAYENLCLFVEFQDGMVELPRLFHEARLDCPQITVPTFHRVLTSLWTKREVELHILNEVREAKEPDKGILRNDKLYYFLYWLKP